MTTAARRFPTVHTPAGEPADETGDDVPMTVPVPRFPGMDWPGDDQVAHVPVALLLAARGRCSCEGCCEAFVQMMRRVRMKAV